MCAPYQTPCELSYALAVSYFSINKIPEAYFLSQMKHLYVSWMTGNSFVWNRSRMWLGRWTFLALYLSLSSDLIKLLFPFLSVAHFFTLPPEGNPVQCLRSPVGHREKSKVNTLSRASKKTRDWELSQSESTCSRKSTNRSWTTAHY